MKKFFSEFKKFITRGNVVDMAVGVIVGSSFTAIVNGLSNYILKPLINALLSVILGADALEKVYTFLVTAYDSSGAIDLANSIYIDWGAFINAIINFFLVAFVLFSIVKIINHLREKNELIKCRIKDGIPTKEEKKEMKALGIKLTDAKAVKAFLAEKDAKEAEEAEKAKAEEEEKAKLEKLNNPTTEDLLKEIRDLLKKDAQ